MSGTRTPPGSMNGVLSVWAHPDDEAICAAGTLALCAARREPVHVVCATRGELGPISDPSLAVRETLGEVRARELRDSCVALGASEPVFLNMSDGHVSWTDHAEPLRVLVEHIRRTRPRVLLSFGADGLYGHPDHTAIGELSTRARRSAADPAFPSVLAPHRVTRHFLAVWTHEQVRALLEYGGHFWHLAPESFPLREADVSARVDVRGVMRRKLRSVRAHRTQLAADHVLTLIDESAAARCLGIERFRCADGLAGDPLSQV
jgi:LmbE family N-acetylglucosaminyl deacetylase